MIVRDRELLNDGRPGAAMLEGVLREHRAGLARLESLLAAYEGAGEITMRARREGLPNNRLAHGYAAYIVRMASGHLAGSPVRYTAAGDPAALEAVMAAYRMMDAQSVDIELAVQASIYGRGAELCYADKRALPRSAALDPRRAFAVYDDTAEHRPLFGVHVVEKTDAGGAPAGTAVSVYTENQELTYMGMTPFQGEPAAARPHFFGGVPLIEYWNNDGERGDFEGVLTLINAYDVLQSDRVNDKQQFADALLVLTGVAGIGGDPDDELSPATRLREDRTLALPDGGAKAEWLIKQVSEADADVLRNAIRNDIHKFSMVPDLSDPQFAYNDSGVAIKYKLLGLEELTRGKERWFREALRTRLRLFSRFLSVRGAPLLDADGVQMQFFRSLPANAREIAETVSALRGLVPDELLLAQIPFVEDPRGAAGMMREQDGGAGKR